MKCIDQRRRKKKRSHCWTKKQRWQMLHTDWKWIGTRFDSRRRSKLICKSVRDYRKTHRHNTRAHSHTHTHQCTYKTENDNNEIIHLSNQTIKDRQFDLAKKRKKKNANTVEWWWSCKWRWFCSNQKRGWTEWRLHWNWQQATSAASRCRRPVEDPPVGCCWISFDRMVVVIVRRSICADAFFSFSW